MVGHTGQIPATIQAVETVDRCSGRLLDSISSVGGTAIVTINHGSMMNGWAIPGPLILPTLVLVLEEKSQIPGHGADNPERQRSPC